MVRERLHKRSPRQWCLKSETHAITFSHVWVKLPIRSLTTLTFNKPRHPVCTHLTPRPISLLRREFPVITHLTPCEASLCTLYVLTKLVGKPCPLWVLPSSRFTKVLRCLLFNSSSGQCRLKKPLNPAHRDPGLGNVINAIACGLKLTSSLPPSALLANCHVAKLLHR